MVVRALAADEVGFPRFPVEPAEIGAGRGAFELPSHARAREALELGLAIADPGFNVFVVGGDRSGRMTATLAYLKERTQDRPTPPDWVYLPNFQHSHRPRPVALPAGRGRELRDAVAVLVSLCRTTIGHALSSESHRREVQTLSTRATAELDRELGEIRERARTVGLDIGRTEDGLALIAAEGVAEPEIDQKRRDAAPALQENLASFVRRAAALQTQLAGQIRQANRRVVETAIHAHVVSVKEQFTGHAGVGRWLEAFEDDVVDNLDAFRGTGDEADKARATFETRYGVNLLVDRADTSSPEVVLEPTPTVDRLFGKIEFRQVGGTLTTDHMQIRPGALHRANGGILVLRAEAIASENGVWELLKGALRDRQIRIEAAAQSDRVHIAGAPDPKPVPLDLKVVVVGSPHWYYSFFAIDPEFRIYFKIKADIDPDLPVEPESVARYGGLVQEMARQVTGGRCESDALALLLGYASRQAGDRTRLSARFELISDILVEAVQYVRPEPGHGPGANAVRQAFDARRRRNSRIEDRLQEAITRRHLLIDTAGSAIGQINALTVRDLGDHEFGLPVRVTARASVGRKGISNIERDVELGGPIQQKSVMVIQGFIAGHFARTRPISFNCSLTFEQSYEGVEGDSASVAELLAVLSDLSGIPLRQDVAVTGSINQQGRVQAVGGVTHKIEGFFGTCLKAGPLSGTQGVLIPSSNAESVILMPQIEEAVREGRFHIWTVDTVDDAIELMTGVPAGAADPDGNYAPGTLFSAVAGRLEAFNAILARDEWEEGEG